MLSKSKKTHACGLESAQLNPRLHNRRQDQKTDRENSFVDAVYWTSSSSVSRGRINGSDLGVKKAKIKIRARIVGLNEVKRDQ
jgi:hypothetical protein